MGKSVQSQKTELHSPHHHCFSSSRRRQPSQHHGKDHDHHQPHPKGREAETQDGTRHDGSADFGFRFQPCVDSERNPDHNGQDQGREGQFEGRRHAHQDQLQGRHAKDKGLAKIALEGIRKEMPVLHVDRFIETEMTNHTINLSLIGFRIDQHIHRITNHIDPDKN